MASDMLLEDWSLQNITEWIYPRYKGLTVHPKTEPFFKGQTLSYRLIFDLMNGDIGNYYVISQAPPLILAIKFFFYYIVCHDSSLKF